MTMATMSGISKVKLSSRFLRNVNSFLKDSGSIYWNNYWPHHYIRKQNSCHCAFQFNYLSLLTLTSKTKALLSTSSHHHPCRNYSSWEDDTNRSDDFPVFKRPQQRQRRFNSEYHDDDGSYTQHNEKRNFFSQNREYDDERSFSRRKGQRNNFSSYGSKSSNHSDFYGSQRRHGDRNYDFFADRFESQELGAKIKHKDWGSSNLSSIEKNFYVLHPEVANRSEESVDEFYSKHNITVSQGERPVPLSDFQEANFPDKVVKYLESNSWSKPTPIQSMGWPIALSGKNMVGLAQTGSGKTLGFILPALVHIKHQRPVDRGEGPVVLVLAPTRELAQQIKSVATEYGRLLGIRSCSIFGGQSKMVQARQISQGPELVVATPGRLLDFLETEVIGLDRTTFVVLDEADRMLDMGFEPQIRKVLSQIRPDRQILMWSATWPKEIQRLAHDFLGEFTQINIGSQELTANPNIEQLVKVCEHREKFGLLLHELKVLTTSPDSTEIQRMPKTLIFAQTKRVVDILTSKLNNRRIKAKALHGDKSQAYRDDALRAFRNGYTDILVATDVAARGLDVDDIKVVINYDYPNAIDDYIHRIGRTARASKTGKAISFFTDEDASKVHDLIKALEATEQEVDPALRDLANFYQKFSKKSSSKPRSNHSRQRRHSSSYNYHRRDSDYY